MISRILNHESHKPLFVFRALDSFVSPYALGASFGSRFDSSCPTLLPESASYKDQSLEPRVKRNVKRIFSPRAVVSTSVNLAESSIIFKTVGLSPFLILVFGNKIRELYGFYSNLPIRLKVVAMGWCF